jgi:hypothetical protein
MVNVIKVGVVNKLLLLFTLKFTSPLPPTVGVFPAGIETLCSMLESISTVGNLISNKRDNFNL